MCLEEAGSAYEEKMRKWKWVSSGGEDCVSRNTWNIGKSRFLAPDPMR